MFEIWPDPKDVKEGWSDERQYLYSLVWSSFLDLDRYTASRAFRRFLPYSSVWVAHELLPKRDGVSKPTFGTRGEGSALDRYKLCPLATDLALWTVAPGLFSAMKGADALGWRRARKGDDEAFVAELREAFRLDFAERFGMDLAASPLDPEFRPIFPPRPQLGIEATATSVIAGRRFATARIQANVQRPFYAMRDVVDPAKWSEAGHWKASGEAKSERGTRSIVMCLRLPGGRFRISSAKNRNLSMKFEIARGPFDRRVDYSAFEPEDPSSACVDSGLSEALKRREEEDDDAPKSPYDKESVHVRGMRGFLAVERLAGRPRWSRVTAERTVAFESPNHDRFRVETLLFWLTSEILAFVANRECS